MPKRFRVDAPPGPGYPEEFAAPPRGWSNRGGPFGGMPPGPPALSPPYMRDPRGRQVRRAGSEYFSFFNDNVQNSYLQEN